MSDPAHPSYGKHLTSAQVNELVKPCDEALDQVHEWLKDHQIDTNSLSYTPAKDWINVNLPVSAIERLLDTKYSVYKHEDGSHLVRTPEWSLPAHLHKHIDTIQPTNSFLRPNARARTFKTIKPLAELGEDVKNGKTVEYVESRKGLTVAEACNTSAVSITCLRTLYGTADYTPQVPNLNSVAINNYLNETCNRSDVSIFLQNFRPDAVSAAELFKVEIIAGGDDQQDPNDVFQNLNAKDLEANLDAETLIGISYPTPLITYNTGGMPPFEADSAVSDNTNEVNSLTLLLAALLTSLAVPGLAAVCTSTRQAPPRHQLLLRRG